MSSNTGNFENVLCSADVRDGTRERSQIATFLHGISLGFWPLPAAPVAFIRCLQCITKHMHSANSSNQRISEQIAQALLQLLYFENQAQARADFDRCWLVLGVLQAAHVLLFGHSLSVIYFKYPDADDEISSTASMQELGNIFFVLKKEHH